MLTDPFKQFAVSFFERACVLHSRRCFPASSPCQWGLKPNDYKMSKGQHTHAHSATG